MSDVNDRVGKGNLIYGNRNQDFIEYMLPEVPSIGQHVSKLEETKEVSFDRSVKFKLEQ